MIGAVEQKANSAGNGAELTDNQPFMVNGIMVENIIFLEIHRIIHKVVIYGVVAHGDAGIGNDIFQIYGFPVFCPGINFLFVHFQNSVILSKRRAAQGHCAALLWNDSSTKQQKATNKTLFVACIDWYPGAIYKKSTKGSL